MRAAIPVLAILLLAHVAVSSAQTSGPSGTVDVTAAELQALMKLGVNNPIKSIDAGKHTF